jgi:hypothetical protein
MEINYLDVTIGTLITEIIFMIFFTFIVVKLTNVSKWYKELGLGAVLSDVTVIILCIAITSFLYPLIFKKFNIFVFTGLAVAIQMTHDVIFSKIIKLIPSGNSRIINIFKSYSETAGFDVLFTDSMMIVSSILFMKLVEGFSLNQKMFILILSLYILPYFLYSF